MRCGKSVLVGIIAFAYFFKVEDLVGLFHSLPFDIKSNNVVLEMSSLLRHIGFCSALMSGPHYVCS